MVTEIFKLKNRAAPGMTETILRERDIRDNLRVRNCFASNNIYTIKFGTETLAFRGPKLRAKVPVDIKRSITDLYTYNIIPRLK